MRLDVGQTTSPAERDFHRIEEMSLHAFNTACLVVALAGILLALTARYLRTGEFEHFLDHMKLAYIFILCI